MKNSSDNYQLPPLIIANMYKNNLVLINDIVKEKPIQQSVSTAISFLGENKKNIVVLVNEKNAVHINDDNLAVLNNILLACKLNMADVAIVNCFNQKVSFNVLKNQFAAIVYIAFAIDSAAIQLPFQTTLYEPFNSNNFIWLQANPLESMIENNNEAKAEKRKLWNCLKLIFNL